MIWLDGIRALGAMLLCVCACTSPNPDYCDTRKPCPQGQRCDLSSLTCVSDNRAGTAGKAGAGASEGNDAAAPETFADLGLADVAQWHALPLDSSSGDALEAAAADAAAEAAAEAEAAVEPPCDADGDCGDNNPCTWDRCEPSGCVNEPEADVSCRVVADDDGICVVTEDGQASCMLLDGVACEDAEGCESGYCVDGVCCEGACDGPCESCGQAGSEGVCTAVPFGADPDDECRAGACATGACNGERQCGLQPAGTDCGVCAACDASGQCLYDETQDADCGTDVRCGVCQARFYCKLANSKTSCGVCHRCDGRGTCVGYDLC